MLVWQKNQSRLRKIPAFQKADECTDAETRKDQGERYLPENKDEGIRVKRRGLDKI